MQVQNQLAQVNVVQDNNRAPPEPYRCVVCLSCQPAPTHTLTNDPHTHMSHIAIVLEMKSTLISST